MRSAVLTSLPDEHRRLSPCNLQGLCISMITPNFQKATGLEHPFCRTHHHSWLELHSVDLLQVKNWSLLPRLFETLWPLTPVVTTLISQYATDLYLHPLWELLELQGAGCDIGSDPSALTHDPNQLRYNSHDTHRLSRWKEKNKCYQHNPNGKGLLFFPFFSIDNLWFWYTGVINSSFCIRMVSFVRTREI